METLFKEQNNSSQNMQKDFLPLRNTRIKQKTKINTLHYTRRKCQGWFRYLLLQEKEQRRKGNEIGKMNALGGNICTLMWVL